MKKSLVFIVTAVALVALVGTSACQSQQATGSKNVELTVATTEFKFTPDTITVKVGDHVKVTLDNSKGTVQHTFVQPDLGINASVDAGKTTAFEFTPTKAGTFDAACDLPGHKEAGMTAKIIVQP